MYKFGIGSGSENRNDFEFICKLMNEKDEKNENILSLDEALWLQAYEGFLTLKSLVHNRALSILQYIFEHVLQGKEIEEDGKTKFRIGDKEYCSLKDEELIDKMAERLLNCYKRAGIKAPREDSLKRSLSNMNMERETLIKLGFAITFAMNKKEKFKNFNNFLEKAGERRLSTAVPGELILICVLKEGGRFTTWQDYLGLLDECQNDCHSDCNYDKKEREYGRCNNQRSNAEAPYGDEYTDDDKVIRKINEILSNFHETQNEDDLKSEIKNLFSACSKVAEKKTTDLNNGVKKQYSKTVSDTVKNLSVLKDDRAHVVWGGDKTIFRSSIINEYSKIFPLDGYGFSQNSISENGREMTLSLREYCLFFTYRIKRPNFQNNGNNDLGLFYMKYGDLSKEINESVLRYTDLHGFNENRKHLIARHDILNVLFCCFLVAHWKKVGLSKEKFCVENSWKDINELFGHFTNYVDFGMTVEFELREEDSKKYWEFKGLSGTPNTGDREEDIKKYSWEFKGLISIGYEGFDSEKPYDALLDICLHSLCQLELYVRIYELNVFSSYINDDKVYDNNYPQKEHIQEVLEILVKIYEKLGKYKGEGRKFGGSSNELKKWQKAVADKESCGERKPRKKLATEINKC